MEDNAAFTVRQETEAITAVTHDVADGQLTSTACALTFRTGDVFAGHEKEQMRITPEGQVGIGTDKPQATSNDGIGTTTPLAKLDIQAGADGQFDPKAIAFQYRSGGYRHWIRTRHNSVPGSGNAIDFFVNDSGTARRIHGAGIRIRQRACHDA